MRKWKYYKPNQEIAGLVILEQLNQATLQEDTYYRIKYFCCNQIFELTHQQIRQRHTKHAKNCVHCSKKKNGKIMGLANRNRPQNNSPVLKPVKGVYTLTGEFWPFLGPMGPRWSGVSSHTPTSLPKDF